MRSIALVARWTSNFVASWTLLITSSLALEPWRLVMHVSVALTTSLTLFSMLSLFDSLSFLSPPPKWSVVSIAVFNDATVLAIDVPQSLSESSSRLHSWGQRGRWGCARSPTAQGPQNYKGPKIYYFENFTSYLKKSSLFPPLNKFVNDLSLELKPSIFIFYKLGPNFHIRTGAPKSSRRPWLRLFWELGDTVWRRLNCGYGGQDGEMSRLFRGAVDAADIR